MADISPPRDDLLRHHLDDQVLVYDRVSDRVHLLDATTAKVVELLDGGYSGEDIARQLNELNETDAGADLLALALDQLTTAGLLADKSDAADPPMGDSTRRQMLQKIAAVGLGVLMPAILTLTPGVTYGQASGFGLGSACDTSAQCASGCCQQGTHDPCINKTCVNPAAPCAVCR